MEDAAPLSAADPDDRFVLEPVVDQPPKHYSAFISYSHDADTGLAPAIQQGLQRLAKPTFRRRALEVFRDDTGLTANPSLWGGLCSAMDGCEWLIVLCSVRATTSVWVGREIKRWLATRGGADRLLLVVTDGKLVWDKQANDFDRVGSTAVHPALFGQLTHEPRHIDMAWVRAGTTGGPIPAERVNLDHLRFRTDVVRVAAALRGTTPEDLDGEDVRIHRRTRRLARSAIAALSGLTVLALVAGGLAVVNQREASAQRDRAEAKSALATSRGLAAQSGQWSGPRRLLLAAQAYGFAPSVEARSALFSAVADPGTHPTSNDLRVSGSLFHDGGAAAAAFSASGTTIASADATGTVRIGAVGSSGEHTTAEASGSFVAFVGDDTVAVADGAVLRFVRADSGAPVGDPVALPEAVTALAGGSESIFFGTTIGTVGKVSPAGAVDVSPDPSRDAVRFLDTDRSGKTLVSADASGQITARNSTTLAASTTTALVDRRVTGLSADGGTVVAVGFPQTATTDVPKGTARLASTHAVATGEQVGQLLSAEAHDVVSAEFTGDSDRQLAVIAFDGTNRVVGLQSPATDRPLLFRGVVGSRTLAPQPAQSESEVDTPTGFPPVPAIIVSSPAGDRLAVGGDGATVVSANATDLGDGGVLPFLTGPTVPLSVSPATGRMLVSGQDGLGLADLTAERVPDPSGVSGLTAPITPIGAPVDSAWLTPDGRTVLTTGESPDSGLLLSIGTDGRWDVLEPELSVRPGASLDGTQIAYAAARLPGAAGFTVVTVDTASGEVVASVAVPDTICSSNCPVDSAQLALAPDKNALALRTAAIDATGDGRAGQEPQLVVFRRDADRWVESGRFAVAATTVPTFTPNGMLRYHDGVETIFEVDPARPAEPGSTTFSLARDRWLLDENGSPVASVACDVRILDDTAQTLGSPAPDATGCTPVSAGWISGSRTVVISERSGRLSTVPADPADLVERACLLAGRNLTRPEWGQFVPDADYQRTCPQHPAGPSGTDRTRPKVATAPDRTQQPDGVQRPALLIQPGLPTPPHAPDPVLGDFPGRKAALAFLAAYYAPRTDSEDEACFVEPNRDETTTCVGVIQAKGDQAVLVDFVGDIPRQWVLIDRTSGKWGLAAEYAPARASGPPPRWVTNGL